MNSNLVLDSNLPNFFVYKELSRFSVKFTYNLKYGKFVRMYYIVNM